jgi:hypothetical protein
MNRMSGVSIHGAFQNANCTMLDRISVWNIDARIARLYSIVAAARL